MSTRGTAGRAVVAMAALALLAAVPAAAGEAFVASGSGTALELTLDAEGLVFGSSQAAIASAPTDDACGADGPHACARGAAELNAGGVAEAHAPGGPDRSEETGWEVPEGLAPLLAGEVGTATAEAGHGDERVHAAAEGAAARLEVRVTGELAERLPQVQEALGEVSDALLGPVAEADPSGVTARVRAAYDALVDDLGQRPLATVEAGRSRSETLDADGVTRALARAQGGTVVIAPLPRDGDDGDLPAGLVVVEVGSASAGATSDRVAGRAEVDPAIVRVRVFDPDSGEEETVELAPGDDPVEIAADTPLATTVHPASASANEDGPGASAFAAGVRIEAFAEPLPPVVLSLAATQAAVNAAAGEPEPEPETTEIDETEVEPGTPVETQTTELPRTGGGAAGVGLGLLCVGAAGLAAALRRRP